MSRQRLDYSVIKPKGSLYYKGKIRGWKNYRSTGETTKARAIRVVMQWFEESLAEQTMTFGEYASLFYSDNCPHCSRIKGDGKSISPEHVSNRLRLIEKYILIDPICRLKLHEMKRNDFLEFRSRVHSMEFSNSYRNKITGTAKTILREALFRELINRDITAGVGQLRENDRKPKHVPTIEEVRSIIGPGDHHQSQTSRIAFIIMAATGMRRSELIALRWDRIHESSILIDKAYKAPGKAGKEGFYGLPKWEMTREIPIPPIMEDALDQWPRLGDYVICKLDGKPYKRKSVNNMWNATLRNLGKEIPGFVPHSLRYFVNSWLLNQGFPPHHVRAYQGWADDSDSPSNHVTRVQKGYLHISVEDMREMAVALSDAIAGK